VLNPDDTKQREEFNSNIARNLGPASRPEAFEDPDIETPVYHLNEDNDDKPVDTADNADDVTSELLDQYVGAKVTLPRKDRLITGRVTGRKYDADGTLRGRANQNPVLDTTTYEVELPDGDVSEYAANVIAENMRSQRDLDGNQHLLMEAIVDHKTDGHAVKFADMYLIKNNRRHMCPTTQGWWLCVQWKDGSTTWVKLADLKESNPIEVAAYMVTQGIEHEPAFAWWVLYILKRRNWIIKTVKQGYQKRTHKFGIQVPRNVKEVYEFDKINCNTLWADAITKEMDAVKILDTPRFLRLNPTDETHAIVLRDPEEEDPFVIPLSLSGVTSYFPSRKLTTYHGHTYNTVLKGMI
jgi:hypothetical protein